MTPNSNQVDIKSLLQRVIEIVMPNLRHYYRLPKKARIVKTYASDGKYYADVQPCRNDESDDDNEPLIPKVEIPVMWGGVERGIVCPPEVGTRCIISYFDGDPNAPFISHIRWKYQGAPTVEIGGFVIQKDASCKIEIDSEKNMIKITPANDESTIGGDWSVNVGGKTVVVSDGGVDIDGGNPALFGAVTGGNICAFTGGPHPDCSQTVRISKG